MPLPPPRSIKDTGEHIVAHVELEAEIRAMREHWTRSLTRVSAQVERVSVLVGDVRDEVIKINENLKHVPCDADISQIMSVHLKEEHSAKKSITPRQQPLDWKAFGAMIAAIIAAVSALAFGLVKAFVN